ncbi:MAG: ferritin-like domain-containing protein [Thermodesulfobacteriota bacterium]
MQKQVHNELGHATFLTDVIVDLGGEPNTTPKCFDKIEDLKAVLELALQME